MKKQNRVLGCLAALGGVALLCLAVMAGSPLGAQTAPKASRTAGNAWRHRQSHLRRWLLLVRGV